jgi:hypothetical protein
MADYGFVGSEADLGVHEFDSPDEAEKIAWELAIQSVSVWVEETEDED